MERKVAIAIDPSVLTDVRVDNPPRPDIEAITWNDPHWNPASSPSFLDRVMWSPYLIPGLGLGAAGVALGLYLWVNN